MRKGLVALGMAGLTLATTLAASRPAEAQTTTGGNRVTALPQGLVGTGLLGAEAFILIEGAVGVRNRWILLGSGALGLVGGCIGGYFIDTTIDNAHGPSEISTGLLVVGIGLVIPAAIMYLSATNYRPEDSAVQEDNAPGAAPLEESGASGGSSSGAGTTSGDTTSGGTNSGGSSSGGTNTGSGSTSGTGGSGGAGHSPRRRYYGPEALLNFNPGRFHVGLPNVNLAGSYTLEEMHHWGVQQTPEWRVPLLSASF